MPRASTNLSDVELARLDAMAARWNVNRASALRRLVAEADPEALAPPDLPDLDELLVLAASRARRGNVSAMNFLARHMPGEREAALQNLLARLGAGEQ